VLSTGSSGQIASTVNRNERGIQGPRIIQSIVATCGSTSQLLDGVQLPLPYSARALARAFLFPFGAPGDVPPCIRHRPFFTAGDWHGLPRRVRAWHRDAWCMSHLLCMGLFLCFRCEPSPRALDVADYGLPAFVNVDVFDRHLLLALATVPIETFEQRRIGPRKLVCMVEVLLSALECLIAERGAPVALHRSVVASDELRGEHAFKLILGIDAD
jgi:hypothetical protein